MIYNNYIHFISLNVGVLILTTGCAWQDPARVESEFGSSVRLMVAEQIFDPEAAHEPPVYGPDVLGGVAADAAIAGYGTASAEARIQRERSENSPIPVVGIVTNSDSE